MAGICPSPVPQPYCQFQLGYIRLYQEYKFKEPGMNKDEKRERFIDIMARFTAYTGKHLPDEFK